AAWFSGSEGRKSVGRNGVEAAGSAARQAEASTSNMMAVKAGRYRNRERSTLSQFTRLGFSAKTRWDGVLPKHPSQDTGGRIENMKAESPRPRGTKPGTSAGQASCAQWENRTWIA